MDATQLDLRDAQGPPGGLGQFLSALTASTSSTTTTSSTTSTSSTTATPTATSQTSSSTAEAVSTTQPSSKASSTSATIVTSAASQSDTTATTGVTSTLSTSTDTGTASTTHNSGETSTNGPSTLSTGIAGASDSQTTTALSSGSSGSGSTAATSAAAFLPVSDAHRAGLSPGAIAAAVVVPVLFALLALLLALFCLRRRARNGHGRTGSGLAFLGAVREKQGFDDGSGPADREIDHDRIPMATTAASTERIHTYLAGLATSLGGSTRGDSQEHYHSTGPSLDNSPVEGLLPTQVDGQEASTAPIRTSQLMMLPLGPLAAPLVSRYSAVWDRTDDEATTPVNTTTQPSPFDDPESSTTTPTSTFLPDELLAANFDERPGTNHSSRRSITSTLYSDAASIHDAQTAQISTAPAARTSTATIVDSVTTPPLSVQIRHVDSGLSPVEGPFTDSSTVVSSMHSAKSSLSEPEVSRSGSVASGVSALQPQ